MAIILSGVEYDQRGTPIGFSPGKSGITQRYVNTEGRIPATTAEKMKIKYQSRGLSGLSGGIDNPDYDDHDGSYTGDDYYTPPQSTFVGANEAENENAENIGHLGIFSYNETTSRIKLKEKNSVVGYAENMQAALKVVKSAEDAMTKKDPKPKSMTWQDYVKMLTPLATSAITAAIENDPTPETQVAAPTLNYVLYGIGGLAAISLLVLVAKKLKGKK